MIKNYLNMLPPILNDYSFYWVSTDLISIPLNQEKILKEKYSKTLDYLSFIDGIYKQPILIMSKYPDQGRQFLYYYAKKQRNYAPILIAIDLSTISKKDLKVELRKSKFYQDRALILMINGIEEATIDRLLVLKQLLIEQAYNKYYKLFFHAKTNPQENPNVNFIDSNFYCISCNIDG